jgi:hypothetical protein
VVSVPAVIDVAWTGIGILVTLAGAAVCWLMLTLARSDRVLDFMYRDNSRMRARLHGKPADPVVYRRGLRAGFAFAALWGVAGVCVGIGLIVAKGF